MKKNDDGFFARDAILAKRNILDRSTKNNTNTFEGLAVHRHGN